MSFGNITLVECVNLPPPADTRCDDPAFALANPDICPAAPVLVVKPEVVLSCELGSVQFSATYTENNVETDVTNECVWTSSDLNTAVVGALSGNATGIAAGEASINANYQGRSASSTLTVLGGNCCEDQTIATMVVVDRTKSMGQLFGATYSTKLAFAKAAASQYISELNETKDTVGLISFDETDFDVLSVPSSNKAAVGALVTGIAQTQQNTAYYDALNEAVAQLAAVSADRKIIVLISDGFDTDTSYNEDDNPIALMTSFKASGGIVVCVGVRAYGRGYALLSALSTGGFFINSYDAIDDEALAYLSGLKGYLCAGQCVPDGDEYVPTGQFNYGGFAKWSVVEGHVDLIGSGFMDLLPGNGLYVDLAGNMSAYKGKMVTKDAVSVVAGQDYRVTLQIAGNQRINASPNAVRVQVFERNNDKLTDPTVAPVVSVNTIGVAATAETYKYAYSYVDANGETDLSPSSSATINNAGDTISFAATANASATLIRVWRTTGETPESRYYLIAEIDPVTATMTDSYHGADMLAAIAATTIDASVYAPDSNTTGTPILLLNQQIVVNNFQQDFQNYNYTFTALANADVFISVQQTQTPVGYQEVGLLLKSVTFTNETTNTQLPAGDPLAGFSDENEVYVPPACGTGTIPILVDGVYGYAVGYDCYGDGCLDNPPAIQLEDPNALTDIELGTVPPKLYSSTVTKCVECPNGQTQTASFLGVADPLMDTDPRVVSNFSITGTPSHVIVSFQTEQTFPFTWNYTLRGSNTDLTGNIGGGTEVASGSFTESSWIVNRQINIPAGSGYKYFQLDIKTLDSITQLLSGLRWEMPISVVGTPGVYGGCVDPADQVISMTGDAGTLFTAQLRFRGVVEKRRYLEAPVAGTGGNLIDNPHRDPAVDVSGNEYYLIISNPYKKYALNGIQSAPSAVYAIDYTGTFQIQGNATVTLQARSIDSQENTNFDAPAVPTTFPANNWTTALVVPDIDPAPYPYYGQFIQMDVGTVSGSGVVTDNAITNLIVTLYSSSTATQIACATETRTSELSQSHATQLATTAATASANALLNCNQYWEETVTVTKACPIGSLGSAVTKSATYKSYISQADAISNATIAATALANAALTCDSSNNTAGITINDTVTGQVAKATPYPSVAYVSSVGTSITNVTLNIVGLTHSCPSDIHIVLLSPDGTAVCVMRNKGAASAITDVDVSFDDAGGVMPSPIVAGTYQCSDGGGATQLPSTPNLPYGTAMADFNGEDPNGSWSLWIIDDSPLDSGSITSWTLTITAV